MQSVKKIMATTLLSSSLIVASGCSDDDDDDFFLPGLTPTGSTAVQSALASAPSSYSGDSECNGIGTLLTSDTLNVGGTDKYQCVVPNRLHEDVTLTNDIIWVLSGNAKVGYGELAIENEADITALKNNRVTLTVEAGTEFRSKGNGVLVVTRGSRIMAEGTASDPIVFSSLEQFDSDDPEEAVAENYEGRGEWGGLVLQGFGKHNKCSNDSADAVCNISGEGAVGRFAGNDNSDNSGTLKYVVVAEGGYEVSVDNEVNGITFQGVGSGTTVDYIQVHSNQDDGVEFFGGDVNVRHVVLTGNRDDSIDWDEGFTGNIQFGIIKHAGDEGDHGMETDNNGSSMNAAPRSRPTLANITLIGDTDDGDGHTSDTGIKHREGTGAFIFNSIVDNFGTCLDLDDSATHDLVDTNLIYTDVIFNCGSSAKDDDENAGADFAQTVVDSSVSSIIEVDPQLDSNYAPAAAEASLGSNADFGSAATADTSFLTATDYAGAVENSSDDWYAGWIISGSL